MVQNISFINNDLKISYQCYNFNARQRDSKIYINLRNFYVSELRNINFFFNFFQNKYISMGALKIALSLNDICPLICLCNNFKISSVPQINHLFYFFFSYSNYNFFLCILFFQLLNFHSLLDCQLPYFTLTEPLLVVREFYCAKIIKLIRRR